MRALLFTALIAILVCVYRSDVAYAAKISANNMNFTLWDQLLHNYVYRGKQDSQNESLLNRCDHFRLT